MNASSRAEVQLRLPTDTKFVALARTAAASLAVEIGFSVDELDELRIAVDEMVTILIEARPSDETVSLTYAIDGGDTFELIGTIGDRTEEGGIDDLTGHILGAVVDSFSSDPTSCSFIKVRGSG